MQRNHVTAELRWASKISKAPLADSNLKTKMNISHNNVVTLNNSKQNYLFKCTMLIPIHLKGRIIGKKGRTIKHISKNSKTSIHIDDSFINYPWKEIKVNISGTPVQCSLAMSEILHLIRQSLRNYPLKIMLNSKNIPHILGKRGNFVRKIKNVSRANLVRVFPENTKNGVLIIKDTRNINCIKAAEITLIKIHKTQLFQLHMSQAKCKQSLSDRKVSQATISLAQKSNENTQTQEKTESNNEMNENKVDNETHKSIKNQKTAENTYDNSATKQDDAQKNSQNSMTKENVVYIPKSRIEFRVSEKITQYIILALYFFFDFFWKIKYVINARRKLNKVSEQINKQNNLQILMTSQNQ